MTDLEYLQMCLDDSLEDRARTLVARESPSSDDEHYERLVARLVARVIETGEFLELAWLRI